MVCEWLGVRWLRVPGIGWRELSKLTPEEAILCLGEMDRLMERMAADLVLIREVARQKMSEVAR